MLADVRQQCLQELQVFLSDPEDAANVAAGQPLLHTAGLDSVAVVEFVVRLEDRFAVEIDADNLEEVFATIDSLAGYIDGKLAAARA